MNSIVINKSSEKLFISKENIYNNNLNNNISENKLIDDKNYEIINNLNRSNQLNINKDNLEFTNLKEFNNNIIEKETKKEKINRMKNEINLFYLENKKKLNKIAHDKDFEKLYNIMIIMKIIIIKI